MKLVHPFLYFFVLVCIVFVCAASLGELLWGESAKSSLHWTTELFYGICHRLPDRTYTMNGLSMAVNTRCFGIFLGILGGWLSIPVAGKYIRGYRFPLLILFAAAGLQFVDYLGNLAEFWKNTNHSRALLGSLFGFAMSISMSDLFMKTKQ